MSIEDISKLRGVLSEVGLCHGAQVLACQCLEHGADLWQPVQVLRPQEPLLNVHAAPV